MTNLDHRACIRLANAILLRAVLDMSSEAHRRHAAWFLATEWAADLAEIIGLDRDRPRKILARLERTRPCLMRPGRPRTRGLRDLIEHRSEARRGDDAHR